MLNGDTDYTYIAKNSPFQITSNNKFFSSSSFDGTEISFFMNSLKTVKETQVQGKIMIPKNDTIMILGNNPDGDGYETQDPYCNWLAGNIYSVRVYDRALTDEEVAHNFRIDKARFNIEEPEE